MSCLVYDGPSKAMTKKLAGTAQAETQTEQTATGASAPLLSEATNSLAAAKVAALPGHIRISPEQLNTCRAWASVFTITAACVIWYCMLFNLGRMSEAIPWYLTIAGIAAFCASHAMRLQTIEISVNFQKTRQVEPLTLIESWSVVYLATAIILYLWVALQATMPQPANRKIIQFIDISLVSESDFANRNSPLPGTQEQHKQHRRDSDATSMQGSLTAPKIAKLAKQSKAERSSQQETQPTQNRPDDEHKQSPVPQGTTPRNIALAAVQNSKNPDLSISNAQKPALSNTNKPSKEEKIPLTLPITRSFTEVAHQASSKPATQEPYFEELQPPELVEMVENDGALDSTSNFEAGGKSSGGAGRANDLSKYIKELHKRIRVAWSPPRGQSRRAKVLFRIKKDGSLGFANIVKSSGDIETDTAALKAVVVSVNRKPLPSDYEFPFLDVQYDFVYGADELKEIKTEIRQPIKFIRTNNQFR